MIDTHFICADCAEFIYGTKDHIKKSGCLEKLDRDMKNSFYCPKCTPNNSYSQIEEALMLMSETQLQAFIWNIGGFLIYRDVHDVAAYFTPALLAVATANTDWAYFGQHLEKPSWDNFKDAALYIARTIEEEKREVDE